MQKKKSVIGKETKLVMIEAVLALIEAVRDGGSSGSEGECGEDEDISDEDTKGKRSISPRHARETDLGGKAAVMSIIPGGADELTSRTEYGWFEEEDDVCVQRCGLVTSMDKDPRTETATKQGPVATHTQVDAASIIENALLFFENATIAM